MPQSEKVPTGFQELDLALTGGFETGSTVALVSDPTSMKDAFLHQFIYNSLKEEHTVVYLCLVRTPAETAGILLKKFPPIEEFIKRKSLVFVNFLAEPFVEQAGLDMAVSEFFGERLTFQKASEFAVKDTKNLLDISLTIKKAIASTGRPNRAIVITESVTDEFLSIDLQLALRFDRSIEAALKNLGVNLLFYVVLKGIRDEFILPFEQHADYVLEIQTMEQQGGLSDYIRVKKSKDFVTTPWQKMVNAMGLIKLVRV